VKALGVVVVTCWWFPKLTDNEKGDLQDIRRLTGFDRGQYTSIETCDGRLLDGSIRYGTRTVRACAAIKYSMGAIRPDQLYDRSVYGRLPYTVRFHALAQPIGHFLFTRIFSNIDS
jgi:hypothetical protein